MSLGAVRLVHYIRHPTVCVWGYSLLRGVCCMCVVQEADVLKTDEVELVQTFVQLELHLQEAMACSSQQPSSSHSNSAGEAAGSSSVAVGHAEDKECLERLQRAMVLAFFRLPLDLKQTMISSPVRRELLEVLVRTPEEVQAHKKLVAGLQ